jgi:hypothetical protein
MANPKLEKPSKADDNTLLAGTTASAKWPEVRA